MSPMRVAVVKDGKVIEILNWTRRVDLERPHADRLVDVSERPDIDVGHAFPFSPRPEPQTGA